MPKSKAETRKFIAQATADFLANGGRITVLPTTSRAINRSATVLKSPLQAN